MVSIVTASMASDGTNFRMSAANSSRRSEGTCWDSVSTISSNTDSLGMVLTYRCAAARRAAAESDDWAVVAVATASTSSTIVVTRPARRIQPSSQILDVHRLAAGRALCHCIRELHVAHAVLEVRVRDLLAAPDG